MKRNLYPKLAWHGIMKNQKTYVPFLLTSIGITMIYYIIAYLTYSKSIYKMHGGQEMQMILSWGTAVIAVFAAIFLFYMNSFLMRRRKTEFGLYNILGMGKWNIARILFWQNLMLFLVSLIGGLGLGIVLSKLSELCAAKVLGNSSPLGFTIDLNAVRNTVLLTAVSYTLILLYSLGQIHVSKPIALLHGEKTGEKPPKARWLIALIGVVLLGIAYYLSVTIKEPIAALSTFFVAVLLVILATYLLFICGSVSLCKILQKNKHYYYQLRHFVSVSSMSYRMKRNGASLASICILSTMVLVMISSSLCLYVGVEDSLRQLYPRDIEITVNASSDIDAMQQIISDVLLENQVVAENELEMTTLSIAGLLDRNHVLMNLNDNDGVYIDYDKVLMIDVFTLDEYNRLAGASETLADGEILIHMSRKPYDYDTIQLGDMIPLHIKKQVDEFIQDGDAAAMVSATMHLIVRDDATLQEIYSMQKETYGTAASMLEYQYAFDIQADADTEIAVMKEIENCFSTAVDRGANFHNYSCRSLEEQRSGFYSLYGGLLFLGILLSVVFLFGTVLIMYYKQISEGYEDASRFEIMQKVGMTKSEIKKSINSQILMVFAAPLLGAGMHTAFAFPLVRRLLILFGLTNTPLLVGITVTSFLTFSILYILMYKFTSHSYYQLVK